ncbi:hypothetical protein IQ277_36200, partial [Nostocales cyanobacterium LEGE 12452]|nr:hypothetical protein [Nostocales cyanobacterium LEGE 12452]
MHEPKQEISQEIPIEIVEVPPQKTDITPPSSFRATKNSLAGGKALPERPVLGLKLGNLAGQKADNERSFDLTASSPLKVFQTGRQQKKTELPNRSGQQPQFKSPKTASASASETQVPNSQKLAVAPMTTPLPAPFLKAAPNPKQIPSVPPASETQIPNSKKIAVAPVTRPQPVPLLKTAPLTTPLVLNPKQIPSAPSTTAQVPNSQKLAVAPVTSPQPAQLGKTALERATTLPV